VCFLQHGGSTNAYTTSEHTNFYFDVNNDCLDDALDRYVLFLSFFLSIYLLILVLQKLIPVTPCLHFRFAQFFIKPLMSPDATLREIKAVDSGICCSLPVATDSTEWTSF
jgi:insulysin